MNSGQDHFDKLLRDVGVAMMSTRDRQGNIRSRAMANQKKSPGADMWFVTAEGSSKLTDLASDPHVNLSYYKDSTREWVSVSGVGQIIRDREKIKELYQSDWKMWFNEEDGDPISGTPDDPRMVLIGVTTHLITCFELDRPTPVALFELAKGWLTGKQPNLGEVQTVET